jgi:hypothetical protein
VKTTFKLALALSQIDLLPDMVAVGVGFTVTAAEPVPELLQLALVTEDMV